MYVLEDFRYALGYFDMQTAVFGLGLHMICCFRLMKLSQKEGGGLLIGPVIWVDAWALLFMTHPHPLSVVVLLRLESR